MGHLVASLLLWYLVVSSILVFCSPLAQRTILMQIKQNLALLNLT